MIFFIDLYLYNMPQYISGGWMEVKTLNILKPQWYKIKFYTFFNIILMTRAIIILFFLLQLL